MKRFILSLVAVFVAMSASALSYDEAREQAWYLTDKMAYELNLTDAQYERVYQINLEYFLSVNHYSDINGYYWRYRDADLGYVLFDWQLRLYRTTNYFYRPLRWVSGAWYFPICTHYRRGYYYFDRPHYYHTWRGGIWRDRRHDSHSPFRDSHFDRGVGMRDAYHNTHHRGHNDYGTRAENARGGGNHYNGGRDNHSNDRAYNGGNHNNDRVSHSGSSNTRTQGGSNNAGSRDRSYGSGSTSTRSSSSSYSGSSARSGSRSSAGSSHSGGRSNGSSFSGGSSTRSSSSSVSHSSGGGRSGGSAGGGTRGGRR